MPSLLDRLHQVPLAVVDVETTGASPRWGDRVIEIGVVRYEQGRPVGRYEALVDPRRPIAAGVTALTGITQAMVAGQPTFQDRLREILPLFQGAVLVGHNVRFDLAFLIAELRRAGLSLADAVAPPRPAAAAQLTAAPAFAESLFPPADGGGVTVSLPDRPAPAVHVLDTVRIARRRFGRGGNALQRLSRRLGIFPAVAHRALADAEATGLVLERLLAPLGGFEAMLVDVMQAQGGAMRLERLQSEPEPLPMEIFDAIEAGRPVRMIYLDREQRRTERIVTPIRIRRRRGTAALVAYCRLREDERTFKLDRIVTLEPCETATESEWSRR